MVQVIKSRADVVGKRDYALFLLFILTGLRRNEVAQLRWKDVNLNGSMQVTYRAKGGEIVTLEIANMAVRDALLDYLNTSGRLADMPPDSPLWTRHDRAGKPGAKLSSHAISKNFKRYAKDAGINGFHLHQIRHTFARIVAEESGSLIETQEALGHKNLSTTRVYVQRIGVKKDNCSDRHWCKSLGDRVLFGAGTADPQSSKRSKTTKYGSGRTAPCVLSGSLPPTPRDLPLLFLDYEDIVKINLYLLVGPWQIRTYPYPPSCV
jgi:hypothetical protein